MPPLPPPPPPAGDKSRKGSVDAPIEDLIALINAQSDVYTTSSCSGRISVFAEPNQVGGGGRQISGVRATPVCPVDPAGIFPESACRHYFNPSPLQSLPCQSTRAAGKKGGEWVFASHERSDPEQVLARVKERACSGAHRVGGKEGGRCWPGSRRGRAQVSMHVGGLHRGGRRPTFCLGSRRGTCSGTHRVSVR